MPHHTTIEPGSGLGGQPEVGCAILTVAHVGWSEKKRLRGHSHFWGSFDTRLLAEGDKKDMTTVLSVDRHKDGESKGRWGFRLQAVPVSGGGGATTLIPQLSDDALDAQRKRVSGAAAKALEALSQALRDHGQVITEPGHPDGPVVSVEQWRAACEKAGLTSSDKPGTLTKAFNRAKDTLTEKGFVKLVGNLVWRVDAPD